MTDARTTSHTSTTLMQALNERHQDEHIVDVNEPMQQVVLFTLSGQPFALKGNAVSEILNAETPVYYVPGLPPSTEGVIHLRGNIESLITLHTLLGLPEGDKGGMILMAHGAGIQSAIRIEQLEDVCELPVSALTPLPDSFTGSLRPYISALWQPDEEQRATALLDIDAVFNAYQQGLG